MPGRCLEGVQKMYRRCLNGVWTVSEMCPGSLEGVLNTWAHMISKKKYRSYILKLAYFETFYLSVKHAIGQTGRNQGNLG